MSSVRKKASRKLRSVFTSSAATDELNIKPGELDHLGPTRQERDSVRHDPIGLRPRSSSRADDRESIHGIFASLEPSKSSGYEGVGASAGDELAPVRASSGPSDTNEGENKQEDEESEDSDSAPPRLGVRSLAPSVESGRAAAAPTPLPGNGEIHPIVVDIPDTPEAPKASPDTTPKASAASSPVVSSTVSPPPASNPRPVTTPDARPIVHVDSNWEAWDNEWTNLSLTGEW